MPPRLPLVARLAQYIDTSGGPDACHPWTGYTVRSRRGVRYGRIREGGRGTRLLLAHRVVLALKTGTMEPPHIEGCHSSACTTTLCCNERHLRWGTRSENELDKRARGEGAARAAA